VVIRACQMILALIFLVYGVVELPINFIVS